MLVCPKCKCEYEEGYTVCSDCNCKLVHVHLPLANDENIPTKKMPKVIGLTGRTLFFGAIFVIGIIILMNSIKLADSEMASIMKAHGGSMDTSNYLIYLEQSIIKFRTVGCILSVLGGLGVLINTRIRDLWSV